MSLEAKGRTDAPAFVEDDSARGAIDFDPGFLDDVPTGAETASRADSQVSLASSTKRRVFPGDYQRRLPELVVADCDDLLHACLEVSVVSEWPGRPY